MFKMYGVLESPEIYPEVNLNHERLENLHGLTQNNSLSRFSPAHRLNYAQVLAATGDLDSAEKQIEIAYEGNPNLKNGYACID